MGFVYGAGYIFALIGEPGEELLALDDSMRLYECLLHQRCPASSKACDNVGIIISKGFKKSSYFPYIVFGFHVLSI